MIVSGWWYTYPSEKYEFVSWDDDIPNIWEKMFQTTNQVCSMGYFLIYTEHNIGYSTNNWICLKIGKTARYTKINQSTRCCPLSMICVG